MIPGSDVSEFQPPGTVPRPIDKFWYVRIGDGANYVDRAYDQHILAAQKAGIYVGQYLFWRSAELPDVQAHRLIVAVLDKPGLMTAAIDVEEGSIQSASGVPDGLTPAQRSARLDQIHARYHAATGRHLVLYTNRDTMTRLLDVSTLQSRDRFIPWIAEWGPRLHPIPGLPAPLLWQTADHGGAGGGDQDLCLGTRASLAALTLHPTIPTPPPPPGLPGEGTLRLWVEQHSEWAGWGECIGPMRWIDAHGLDPETRCWIAWRGSSWTGAADVEGVVHHLLTQFQLI